jgi:hypothetical protein
LRNLRWNAGIQHSASIELEMADVKPVIADNGDSLWLSEMIDQVHVQGKRSQNGFKPEAWKACEAKMKEHGINRSVKQIKERYRYVSV